jgi:integral membrane protein (TIGR01906 family)
MTIIGVFILAIPLALITTTIRVAISEKAVYDYGVENYGAEKASNIPQSELLQANKQIRDYLVRPDPGPLAPRVTNIAGETESLFNARETAHMADVRSLVQLMFKVQVFSAALVLMLAVVMAVLWPIRALAAAMLYGSLLTLGVLAMAGLAAMSGFDAAWSQFHGIAFSNNLWELNPRTDHLIQMYPEAFWQDAVTAIGGFIAMQALVMGIVAGLYLLLTRQESGAVEPPAPRDLPDRDGYPRRPRLAPPNPRQYIH